MGQQCWGSWESPKGTLGVRCLVLGASNLPWSLLWAVKLGVVRVGLGRILTPCMRLTPRLCIQEFDSSYVLEFNSVQRAGWSLAPRMSWSVTGAWDKER